MSSLLIFFIFIPFLAFVLIAINFIFASHNPYQEKVSAFECGFHSFLGQNRTQFAISFFLFALLFLLFDLEILLVYPYALSSYANAIYGLAVMLTFFFLVSFGLIFELGKKALAIMSKQYFMVNFNKLSSYLIGTLESSPKPHAFVSSSLQSNFLSFYSISSIYQTVFVLFIFVWFFTSELFNFNPLSQAFIFINAENNNKRDREDSSDLGESSSKRVREQTEQLSNEQDSRDVNPQGNNLQDSLPVQSPLADLNLQNSSQPSNLNSPSSTQPNSFLTDSSLGLAPHREVTDQQLQSMDPARADVIITDRALWTFDFIRNTAVDLRDNPLRDHIRDNSNILPPVRPSDQTHVEQSVGRADTPSSVSTPASHTTNGSYDWEGAGFNRDYSASVEAPSVENRGSLPLTPESTDRPVGTFRGNDAVAGGVESAGPTQGSEDDLMESIESPDNGTNSSAKQLFNGEDSLNKVENSSENLPESEFKLSQYDMDKPMLIEILIAFFGG